MRHVLFAAIAALPLMSGAAFAGNEQINDGSSAPVTSAPALVETNSDAIFQPGPTVTLSRSQAATNETGNERPAVFDGVAASGGASFAQN